MEDLQMAAPDRNMALEMVRATEAAAMAAGRWMGRGDKNGVDGAAVNAMRFMLNNVNMDGQVVIGEGEKDEAPMLFNGEKLGTGCDPQVDIAVDPIDGTRLTAQGLPNAVSVVAFAERGTMFDPQHIFYMDKIATGPFAAHAINIDATMLAACALYPPMQPAISEPTWFLARLRRSRSLAVVLSFFLMTSPLTSASQITDLPRPSIQLMADAFLSVQ